MHQPDPFSTILVIHSSVGVSSLYSDAERACTIYKHVTMGKSLEANTVRAEYTENRGGWVTISDFCGYSYASNYCIRCTLMYYFY